MVAAAMSASFSGSAIISCTRCRQAGHLAKDCTSRPFLRLQSIAEERAQRQAQKALREAEAAKQRQDFEARAAAWERRRQDFEARRAEVSAARRLQRGSAKWEVDSAYSGSTVSTEAPATVSQDIDEAKVECMAGMDKQVRKLRKTLREICQLECCSMLDTLQAAKLARKREVEVELDSTLGLAKARARNTLRQGLAD